MRRGLLVLVVLSLATPPAAAQHGRFPRRVLVAGIGALLAGTAATIYALSFENDIGGCSDIECVVPVTVAGGALIGYMIGREMDQLYALRYRSAPPLEVRGRQLPLSVTPTDAWYDARTVLVAGEGALELVRADSTLAPLGLRARGVRGIGPTAADAGRNLLLVGTPAGLYRFALRDTTPGTLVRADEISALAEDGRRVAIGTGPDLLLATLGDSLTPLGDVLIESARVVDLVWRDDVLWALTEDRLAAFRVGADGGVALGAHAFTGLARRLDVHDSLAAVAVGSHGVVVLSVADPAAPRPLATWAGAHFAYDAVVRDSTVYVAGGPEGLYVLRLEPGALRAIGLVRDVGFISALAADATALYLLDRTGARLRRVRFDAAR